MGRLRQGMTGRAGDGGGEGGRAMLSNHLMSLSSASVRSRPVLRNLESVERDGNFRLGSQQQSLSPAPAVTRRGRQACGGLGLFQGCGELWRTDGAAGGLGEALHHLVDSLRLNQELQVPLLGRLPLRVRLRYVWTIILFPGGCPSVSNTARVSHEALEPRSCRGGYGIPRGQISSFRVSQRRARSGREADADVLTCGIGFSFAGFCAWPSLGACSFVCSFMAMALMSATKPCGGRKAGGRISDFVNTRRAPFAGKRCPLCTDCPCARRRTHSVLLHHHVAVPVPIARSLSLLVSRSSLRARVGVGDHRQPRAARPPRWEAGETGAAAGLAGA